MTETNTWYFAGIPVTGPKFIALGRRNWYTAFANQLTKALGTKVYLCDFMDWIDETRPEDSLYFFIRSSDRIDIHLKDIPKEDLQRATVGVGRRVFSRQELRIHHMTGWEINQVFHDGHTNKTYWHTGGSMSMEEAYNAMGKKVPIDRIIESRLANEDFMGATRMSSEEILRHYKEAEVPPLENLLRKVIAKSWSSKLTFYESYGSLIIAVHGYKTNRYTGMLEISVHHQYIFIVQVYDSQNQVTFWDRNVDAQQVGRMLIELIKKG